MHTIIAVITGTDINIIVVMPDHIIVSAAIIGVITAAITARTIASGIIGGTITTVTDEQS